MEFPSQTTILPQKAPIHRGKLEVLFALFAGGKLVVRKLAGLALAAGVLVSVAGCSFNPHPETLQSYAPSDGIGTEIFFFDASGNAIRNQEVAVRNLLIVTDGEQHKLFGTVINSGTKEQSITLRTSASESQTVTVPAGQTFVFNGENPTTIPLRGKAGDVFKMQVAPAGTASGSAKWKQILVPLVDSAIPYYAGLLETATPIATPVVTETPATPAPSPSQASN
jgi:hypothetical protein